MIFIRATHLKYFNFENKTIYNSCTIFSKHIIKMNISCPLPNSTALKFYDQKYEYMAV